MSCGSAPREASPRSILLDTYSFHLASDAWEPTIGQPRDILWIAGRAREMGFEGLHSADMRHFHDELSVEAIASRLNGLALLLGTGGTDPAHLREMVRLSRFLRQPVFRTFLGAGSIRRKIRNLREVMPAAEAADIVVAVENHQDLTSEEMLAVIREVGSTHLGVCLDLGNALGVREEPLTACEALAPHAFMTHVKDYAVAPLGTGYVFWSVPPGTGACRVGEQLAILFEKSPWHRGVPLCLEAPVESIDMSETDGRRVLSALPQLAAPPAQGDAKPAEEQRLAEEEMLVRESFAGLAGILRTLGESRGTPAYNRNRSALMRKRPR